MSSDYEAKRRKFLRHRKDNATPAAIVCTNRGAHQRWDLTPVMVFADGAVEIPDVLLLRKSDSGRVVPADTSSPLARVPRTGEQSVEALNAAPVWEFSCSLCTRTPRVPKALIAAAVAAGQKVVDVSYHE